MNWCHKTLISLILISFLYYYGSIKLSKNHTFIKYNANFSPTIKNSIEEKIFIKTLIPKIQFQHDTFKINNEFIFWIDKLTYRKYYGLLSPAFTEENEDFYSFQYNFKLKDKGLKLYINEECYSYNTKSNFGYQRNSILLIFIDNKKNERLFEGYLYLN